MEIGELLATATELGSAGAIMILSFLFWQRLKEKDDKYDDMTNKVLEAFQKQTEVTTNINNTVENNTKAIDRLTDQLYDVIKKGGENK